jgi:hypothetical protein
VQTTLPENHKQWLIPFAIQLIPSGLLIIGALLIRESPRYLMIHGKREQGIKNLCWIRQLPADHIYMIEEIGAIDQATEELASTVGIGFWKPIKAAFTTRKYQFRLFIGAMLFVWQNGSGINAINYYSPTVFKSIGVTGTNSSLLTTGLFGCVKTAVTIVWILYLIDHVGRRNLLIYGALGGSVCMWIIGAYIKIAQPTKNPTSHLDGGGIAAIFFFYLWTTFYTPTWNGTPWVLNSVRLSLLDFVYNNTNDMLQEMFDQNMRSFAQACAAASNWLWNFLISRFTPQMFDTMGYGVYFFFASLMLLSIVFVFFLVPETKGIPLENMDMLFELKPFNAHSTVLKRLREDEEQFREAAKGVQAEKSSPPAHVENAEAGQAVYL